MNHPHLLQPEYVGIGDMRGFYSRVQSYPSSTNGDISLILSHIAYHCGIGKAARTSVKPSRGHSYRVAMYGTHGSDDLIVRITDHFDHRAGVVGLI